MSHANRKQYFVIFFVLAALTALEVGVVYLPGISKAALVVALIGLALTKAGLVALFYMHLKSETPLLKWTVAIPMATPALYAAVLIAEAAWRMAP
jgi:cytochrome c oxidase subunit IV